MNRENVLKAIAIMERAKARGSLCMADWQLYKTSPITREGELHVCGNKACFAGHIAFSPEFEKDGGSVGGVGEPRIFNIQGSAAISEWLSISRNLSDSLVFGDNDFGGDEDDEDISKFYYGKLWKDVTADDVLVKLHMILNGELT